MFSSAALLETSSTDPDVLQKEIGKMITVELRAQNCPFRCIEEFFFCLFTIKQPGRRRMFGRRGTGYPFGKVPGKMSKQGQRACMPWSQSHSRLVTVHTSPQILLSLAMVSVWRN